jgi:hypothetical protein
MSYLLLFNDCEKVIPHQVNFLSALTKSFNLLQTSRGIIDLPILSKDGSFLHHLIDVLVDGQDAVKDLPGALGTHTSFTFYGICILFGLLFCFLQSPFDPR